MQPLRFLRLWVVGGACQVALVCAAILAPAGELPATGVGDRAEHVAAFLGLTFWFSGILSRRLDFWLGSALFALGAALEGLQAATALGRVADVGDAAANGAGIAIGLLLARAGLGEWMRWVEARVARP